MRSSAAWPACSNPRASLTSLASNTASNTSFKQLSGNLCLSCLASPQHLNHRIREPQSGYPQAGRRADSLIYGQQRAVLLSCLEPTSRRVTKPRPSTILRLHIIIKAYVSLCMQESLLSVCRNAPILRRHPKANLVADGNIPRNANKTLFTRLGQRLVRSRKGKEASLIHSDARRSLGSALL